MICGFVSESKQVLLSTDTDLQSIGIELKSLVSPITKVWWKTRVRGYADMRICGYADMRVCGYAGMRICGYADMRVRPTGLTNRFQKLINNSKKMIAVNTKNHSCEGLFICGKTHVDFHKTLTSIFSAYTTSIY